MLKVILMIDCNVCGQPFDRLLTSSEKDSFSWKSLSLDLEDAAMDCGWSFWRSAHYCDYCMTDVGLSLLQEVESNPNLILKKRIRSRRSNSPRGDAINFDGE